MTKFYTGRGDRGHSFVGQRKISKTHPLVAVLGELDELNSWVGFCRAGANRFKKLTNELLAVQQALFILQAELAGIIFRQSSKVKIGIKHIVALEQAIAGIDKQLPPITKFVIPGASELSARLDIARTLARRAERALKAAAKTAIISPELLGFANRLSSYLFAAARWVNWRQHIREIHPSY